MQAKSVGTDAVLSRPFTAPVPRRAAISPSTTNQIVEASPPYVVQRRAIAGNGMVAETVKATVHERLEFRFRAPLHLLAVFEQGMRVDGTTFVEGLPRSQLRDLTRKITFVPAGHEFHEWHESHTLLRVVFLYVDPAKVPVCAVTGIGSPRLAPRMLFEDAALFDTAIKLKRLIDATDSNDRHYFEALSTVLAHELMRTPAEKLQMEPLSRGGLAAWQLHIVTRYIEEHIEERISLATLAKIVRLSPYYFCRAFGQSLGVPPHRYHNSRRIERAKALLADSATSVTDIGLALGFNETSSFTRTFHKMTGLTPTAYRRALL
jgi:AraC family transcriptional regulator